MLSDLLPPVLAQHRFHLVFQEQLFLFQNHHDEMESQSLRAATTMKFPTPASGLYSSGLRLDENQQLASSDRRPKAETLVTSSVSETRQISYAKPLIVLLPPQRTITYLIGIH